MSKPLTACEWLFGFLAVQLNFVRREDLAASLEERTGDGRRELAEVLLDRRALTSEVRDLVQSVVQAHLARHGGDAGGCLAALRGANPWWQDLKPGDDTAPEADQWATRLPDHPQESTATDPANASTDVYITRAEGSGGTAPQGPSGTPCAGGPRFRKVRLHAKGGLGEVFVALDAEVGREVALKEIQERYADHAGSRMRFLLEAEVTGNLEHPGVVPVYGLGQYLDGRPYYAMRFISGASFEEAIRAFHQDAHLAGDPAARSLALRQLLRRFIDLCNTIAYAHSRGVLHRDLKPANVMLGQFGETLVVDWGLAKPFRRPEGPADVSPSTVEDSAAHTSAGAVIGTPQFMSPEQASGQIDQLGPASDIYSLGAILYVLLCGQPPVTDATIPAVLEKVRAGAFLPPARVKRGVPPALDAVCRKALARVPEERYASAKDLADEVEHWLGDEPVSAYQEPWRERLGRWVRRHQSLVAGAGGLLLTATVTMSLAYWLLSREQARTVEAQRERALAQVNALLDASPQAVPSILQGLAEHPEWVTPRLHQLRRQPDLAEPHRTRVSLALLARDPDEVEYLRQRLLDAEPGEMILIRDALQPFRDRLMTSLWALARDETADVDRRFRAVAVLATFDPRNERWQDIGDRVVARFLQSNPLHLGLWIDALRPVRESLLAPLAKAFRERSGGERRQVAATILADYAADRPELLVDLLLDADPRQFPVLFARVQMHRATALAMLNRELDRAARPEWDDPLPEAAWTAADPALLRQIEAADGLLADHFALCQTMPLGQFAAACDGLRRAGYRPHNVRPYNAGRAVQMAALWVRDGRAYAVAHDLTVGELRERDRRNLDQGLLPADVAVYLTADGQERFAALWLKRDAAIREARLYAGVPAGKEHKTLTEALAGEGFVPRTQTARKVGSEWRYSGVWWKPVLTSDKDIYDAAYTEAGYTHYLSPSNWQADVRLAVPAPAAAADPFASAVWHMNPARESREMHGLAAAAHREQGRKWTAEGWRPTALSVTASGAGASLRTASAWHRPVVSTAVQDALAKRQAGAAVALLRLGQAERVWPLLKHAPQPRVRSQLVHLFGPLGADPKLLMERLKQEDDAGIRRACILSLGAYEARTILPPLRRPVADQLLDLYRTDPDPGIHGAVGWLLRQRWERSADLAKVDAALAGRPPELRRWFINTQGQTFTVVPGPVEFLMGSPPGEPGRRHDEKLHRRRIGRSFAIAAEKVTVEQFERFLSDVQKKHPGAVRHTHGNQYSPGPQGPIIGVNWFEAAAYCRWLSEQEGVPEEQMCYPPIPDIKEGMKLPAAYLKRTGYRLPTEAEWEFAARAGATTARFYGDDDELLDHYAWTLLNAQDHAWPVGQLKPNDLGLFDALGNTWDWVQNQGAPYQVMPGGAATEDVEELLDPDHQGLRGGSFYYVMRRVRCAYRDAPRPAFRGNDVGLRVARTWP